jgi:hypothetical protein
MIRAAISIVVCTFLSTSAFASDPFTLFEGKDTSAPKQPQACISFDGIVHVTFGVGDQVFYCNIEGEKCSVPQAAFRIPNLSLGLRRGPRIAQTGTAIVVTAIGGPIGKGKDGDILAYRSLDNGKSWLGPVRVNDVAASAREGLHAMTSSENGTLWCVWLDLRERGPQLFASKSVDHGATWSKNVMVYRSPNGSVCECCHPSIVASKDSLHVLFRNSLQGNRDMYLVSSRDGGKTFGTAVRLGQSNWQLNACPMDGGMLAIDENQKISTVWRRDRSIFSTDSQSDLEKLLGVGDQPWVTNSDNGSYFVWTSKRDGDLLLKKPGNSAIDRIGDNASFPVVISAVQRVPLVCVFWEKRMDHTHSIIGYRIK